MRFTENPQKSIAYFSDMFESNNNTNTFTMKGADLLLSYMDELQRIIEVINSYIDKGLDLFRQAKEWVERIIEYIGRGIDYIVNALGAKRPSRVDHLVEADDYMFV